MVADHRKPEEEPERSKRYAQQQQHAPHGIVRFLRPELGKYLDYPDDRKCQNAQTVHRDKPATDDKIAVISEADARPRPRTVVVQHDDTVPTL